jgi:hypothetical protein
VNFLDVRVLTDVSFISFVQIYFLILQCVFISDVCCHAVCKFDMVFILIIHVIALASVVLQCCHVALFSADLQTATCSFL